MRVLPPLAAFFNGPFLGAFIGADDPPGICMRDDAGSFGVDFAIVLYICRSQM